MFVGVVELNFLIPGCRSLKEKRRVVNSLKQLLRNRYNCSVAETEYQDLWARAQLAVAVVAGESGHVREQLDNIIRFADTNAQAELVDHEIEMY